MTADSADTDPEHTDYQERVTAPQGPYNSREVGVGLAILFVGILVAFVVPLALA